MNSMPSGIDLTSIDDCIIIKREPFEIEEVVIILPGDRNYTVTWLQKDFFLMRMKLEIPEMVFDAVFNFNEVHWYPVSERMDIQ